MPYKDPDRRREYQRLYQRDWRERNEAKARAISRGHYARNAEQRREVARARDKLKRNARNAVRTAVANGTLTRPANCPACGREAKIEAHHDDYTRALDVRWLCRRCHAREHAA